MAALMALLLAPLSGGPARLRLVDEERFPLARCLDGSRPPFYYRPATSATAKDKWFIHHMGGDFCGYGSTWGQWVDNCRLRANSTLGSSVWYEKNQRTWQLERSGVDFFDADPSRNPLMHDWNWVYLVYCDGHYYAGANTTRTFAPVPSPPGTPPPPPIELFFRGRYNIEGILGTLTATDSFAAATDVVIGGCSSGGVAVFSNADHIHSLLPPTARVAAAANSGYYLNINTESWTRPVAIMANLTGTLSRACVESAEWRDQPWYCIVAEVAAPYVSTMPIFAWQSRYDSNQLSWSCSDCADGNTTAINLYGARLVASVDSWLGGNATSVPKAAFVDACHRHCGCSTGIAAASDGINPKQAFAKWWAELWSKEDGRITQPKKSLWVQPGTFPCKNCCPADQTFPGVGWLNDSRTGCGGCSDDSGCSFNGICKNGACRCDPQWRGPQCASLNLIPTARKAGYQPHSLPPAWTASSTWAPPPRPKTKSSKQVSTWGGPVVRSADGMYHMFASTFVNGCNVWEWVSNSIITHAVSQSPTGPYEQRDCAMETCAPEAHEGSVAVAPTGEFVLFFTSGSDGPGGSTPIDGGGHCDCSSDDALNRTCDFKCLATVGCFAGHWNRSSEMATFMSHTPPEKPEGPWSKPVRIPTADCQDPPFNGSHYCLDSNLAVVILDDGSLLGVGRSGVYNASDWRKPETYKFGPTAGAGGEDPFIYFDGRSPPVLHMLRHTGRDTGQTAPNVSSGNHGRHFWSADKGRTWSSVPDTLAYGCEVECTDGGSECVIMRERPHLIFAADGVTPMALSTAAMHGPPVIPGTFAQNRTSFTLVQALNQH